MKKPLVLLWKILKKSKNHYKTCGFLRKKVVKPISNYGFGPWSCNTRLEKLWGTLTDKLFREPLVLLCFRSQMLKNHWFYCVFAQKCWKTMCFTVYLLKNIEKPLVLLHVRSKTLKKHLFYCVFAPKSSKNIEKHVLFLFFWSKSCIFTGNPCAKMQKTQKSEKTITFYMKNFQPLFKTILFCKKLERKHPLLAYTGGSRRRQ